MIQHRSPLVAQAVRETEGTLGEPLSLHERISAPRDRRPLLGSAALLSCGAVAALVLSVPMPAVLLALAAVAVLVTSFVLDRRHRAWSRRAFIVFDQGVVVREDTLLIPLPYDVISRVNRFGTLVERGHRTVPSYTYRLHAVGLNFPIDDDIDRLPELGEALEQGLARHRFDDDARTLAAGGQVVFDWATLGPASLTCGDRTLAYADITGVEHLVNDIVLQTDGDPLLIDTRFLECVPLFEMLLDTARAN